MVICCEIGKLHIPDSAVKVLPTPGGPLKSIIIPWPILEINQNFHEQQEPMEEQYLYPESHHRSRPVLHLALGECENQFFVVLRKDEALEGSVIPPDVRYRTNRKRDLDMVS